MYSPTRRNFKVFFLLMINAVVGLPFYLINLLLALGLAFFPLSFSQVAYTNLRTYGKYSPLTARRIVAGLYMSYIFYIFEALFLYPLGLCYVTNEKDWEEFIVSLEQRYKSSVGFVILSAHCSHLEMMALPVEKALLQARGKSYYVLAKPPRSPFLFWLLQKYRQYRNVSVLWTHSEHLYQTMSRVLSEGYSLGLITDQKPKRNGIFVNFFNEYAAFPYKGIEIGLQKSAPFVYLSVKRLFPGIFELKFAEGYNTHLAQFTASNVKYSLASVHKQSTGHEFAAAILAGFSSWLEALIRESPSQWCWEYRKWSRKPS